VFTGTPGKYVPLENTLKDFKGLLEVGGGFVGEAGGCSTLLALSSTGCQL